VLTISISADDPEALSLAREAFRLHGGLKEENGHPQYVLTLQLGPPFGASLKLNGVPEALFSFSVKGGEKRENVLKACDGVVEKLFQTPGFFASRILFVAETGKHYREIYLSDLLFRDPRPMTHHCSQSLLPRWCGGNGRKMAYTSYFKSGSPDIFTMDLVTGQVVPLAAYRGTNSGVCFVPGTNQIVFGSSARNGSQLYRADLFGRVEGSLTQGPGIRVDPACSPDGRWMAFGWDRGNGKPRLYQVSLDRARRKELPQPVPVNLSGYVSEPCWHPDGTKILFTAAVNKGFQIGCFDDRTKESRFLTVGPRSHLEGRWLKDGRHILCTERTNSIKRLVIFDTVTRKIIPLPGSLKNASQADVFYPQ
jgi:TolB protein